MYSQPHMYIMLSTYNTNIQVCIILYRTGHRNTFTKILSMDGWGLSNGFSCRGVDFSIREFRSFSTVGRLLVARLVVNNFVFGSMLLSLYYFFDVFVYCFQYKIVYIHNKLTYKRNNSKDNYMEMCFFFFYFIIHKILRK